MEEKLKNKKVLFIIGGVVLVAVVMILFFTLRTTKYTVTFNSDGGTNVASVRAEENKKITLPTNVIKEGYIFSGWMNEENIVVNNNYQVVKDITLKAYWITASSTITITFDSAGGTAVAPIIIDKGEELVLPQNPTKSGYSFVAWIDKNGTPIYDRALLDGDITLTATWNEVAS